MEILRHSVTLNPDKCNGCTHCIKRCPTEAIRIYKGKAFIIEERCIDCGECIRRCPYGAKKAVTYPLSMMGDFRYTIALPAPSLYGQFHQLASVNLLLTSLKKLGFNKVYEVAYAAERVTRLTQQLREQKALNTPIISSACPAVGRLIQMQFPHLRDQVLPILNPPQVAARAAREEAMAETGYATEEIGVFLLTPCPAKITDIRYPMGMGSSYIDGAFGFGEIYPHLLEEIGKTKEIEPLSTSGTVGISWAINGGEASALLTEGYLAADGMENIVEILEQLEDNRLSEVEFIELNVCPGGCVGGVLTVENPFVAKARIQSLVGRPWSKVTKELSTEEIRQVMWKKPLRDAGVLRLSDDIMESMAMLAKINEIAGQLPAMDCGSCGAPTCKAMAEDIVKGHGRLEDCMFVLP